MQLELHLAVFPPVHRFVQRQEVVDRSFCQLLCNALLMVRARICRVPSWLKVVERRTELLRRRTDVDCLRFHPKLASTYGIQLRPVTYRGVCDLTHLQLITYSQSWLTSTALAHHPQCCRTFPVLAAENGPKARHLPSVPRNHSVQTPVRALRRSRELPVQRPSAHRSHPFHPTWFFRISKSSRRQSRMPFPET